MPSRDKYTDPELRDQVKEEIHNSDKGGKPGQWSARKAQMMAAEYKKRGGDYTTDKETGQDESQKNLNQWTEEEWQTKEGSGQAKQDDEEGTRKRYLPKKAWEQMSEKEKKETDEKKVEGSKEGKQFVGNTEEAKGARKAASKGEKEEEKEEEEKEEEDDDEKAQTKDQGKGDKKQQQQKQKQTDKKDNSEETEAPKTRSASKAEAKAKKDDENNNTNNKTDKNADEEEDVDEEKAQAGTKRTAKQSNASNKKQKEDDSSAKDDKKDSTNEKQEQAEDANEEEYVPEEDADADEEMDEAEK